MKDNMKLIIARLRVISDILEEDSFSAENLCTALAMVIGVKCDLQYEAELALERETEVASW